MTSLTNATFLAVASIRRHIEGGTDDLQGKPGKPSAGSYVHQSDCAIGWIARNPREMVELRNHGDGIEKEAPLDLRGVSYRRQVELRASFEEKIPVAGEARQGVVIERHAKSLGCVCQTGPDHCGAGTGSLRRRSRPRPRATKRRRLGSR